MSKSSTVFTVQSLFAINQSLLGLPVFSDSGLIQRLFGRAGHKVQTVCEEKRKTNA